MSYNVLTGNTYLSATAPVGSLAAYLGSSDPPGWVICDGVERSNSDGRYSAVANLGIGTLNGSTYTTINYSGAFLRGIGTSSIVSDYVGPTTLGSYQDQQIVNHGHDHSAHYHQTVSGVSTKYYVPTITNTLAEDAFNSNNLLYDVVTKYPLTSVNRTGYANPESYSGADGVSNGSEIRPYNYGVNWILKL